MIENKIHIFNGDLSNNDLNSILDQGEYMSIDTETTGLDSNNSDIKLVQITADGKFYLLRIDRRRSYQNFKYGIFGFEN